MSITLCHSSALEMLNVIRVCDDPGACKDPSARLKPVHLNRCRSERALDTAPSPSEIKSLLGTTVCLPQQAARNAPGAQQRTLRPSSPAHVLVNPHADRTRLEGRVAHRFSGELPPKSLVRISPELLVASPELLVTLAARHLDELELTWLCCELLATYAIVPSEQGATLLPAYPLTTKDQLAAYLETARSMGVRGATKALAATRRAMDGASSPPEIELALLMTMPCAKGGRAIPLPQLNHRIDIDRRLVATAGRSHYVADACWPNNGLVVEYDGDACHLDSASRAQDNDRTAALEQLGYRVLHVSTSQLKSLSLIDAALKRVANHLGCHTRDGAHTYDWQARRSNLYLKLHKLSTQGINWASFGTGAKQPCAS